MTQCPRCGTRLYDPADLCPQCLTGVDGVDADDFDADDLYSEQYAGSDNERLDDSDEHNVTQTADDSLPMAVIARFHSAAEAGFFAHELGHSTQMQVSVTLDETFDAISGLWLSRFELTVPAAMAKEARTTLEQLIQQTETDGYSESVPNEQSHLPAGAAHENSYQSDQMEEQGGSSGGVHWVPIVLTLAAGSAAFISFRTLNNPPQADPAAAIPEAAHPAAAPVERRPEARWKHLRDKSNTWQQRSKNGRLVRELRFDKVNNRAILREDADGDGVFEAYHELGVPE